jgi:hypothetical protein
MTLVQIILIIRVKKIKHKYIAEVELMNIVPSTQIESKLLLKNFPVSAIIHLQRRRNLVRETRNYERLNLTLLFRPSS